MEQSNRIQRSEVWEQIYKVVKQIPTKEVDEDCIDAPSAATEIEKLFLKLLSIQHISNPVNCDHPRSERSYIGQNIMRCNKCGKEFS